MPTFIIERELAGVGAADAAEVCRIAHGESAHRGTPRARWLRSFACSDRLLCLWLADDLEAVTRAAARAAHPILRIHGVERILEPEPVDLTGADVGRRSRLRQLFGWRPDDHTGPTALSGALDTRADLQTRFRAH